MSYAAHPIARAWLSTGGTGAQNYDEFADDAEITGIIAARPDSALAVEMPHRAPASLGRSFTESLPEAGARLAAAKHAGRYRRHDDVVGLYRIGGQSPAYGLWAMVDTAEISTSAGEPGRVIRNEDVFPEKVRERVALAHATGHLLSPVLLLRTGADDLHTALVDAVGQAEAAGPAAVVDTDQAGRGHEIWPLGPGARRDAILALAGAGNLVVADGNHRSLAAQTAGLPRFLAVLTTPGSVTIQPYNRLVSELTLPPDGLLERLASAGARIGTPVSGPVPEPAGRGEVVLYAAGRAYPVRLPREVGVPDVDNLDHALVERVVLQRVLGLDPGDKRVGYIGGDHPGGWLVGEVDAGRAELAVLVAPVRVEDFVAVNLARLKLPRKSTWFTPKARAGLVLAQLDAEG